MKRFPKKNLFYGIIFLVVILLLGIFLALFLGRSQLEGLTNTLTPQQLQQNALLSKLNGKVFSGTNAKFNRSYSITLNITNDSYVFSVEAKSQSGQTTKMKTLTFQNPTFNNQDIVFKTTEKVFTMGANGYSNKDVTYTITPDSTHPDEYI